MNQMSPFDTKALGEKRTFLRKVQSKAMDKQAIHDDSKQDQTTKLLNDIQ